MADENLEDCLIEEDLLDILIRGKKYGGASISPERSSWGAKLLSKTWHIDLRDTG
jgi:hypothetical protein